MKKEEVEAIKKQKKMIRYINTVNKMFDLLNKKYYKKPTDSDKKERLMRMGREQRYFGVPADSLEMDKLVSVSFKKDYIKKYLDI